jgi:citrate synthase
LTAGLVAVNLDQVINPRSSSDLDADLDPDLGLGSAEVADRLGVKLDTVYAYVSRGLLARRIGPDGRSRFDAMDVERLAARGRAPGARTAVHRPVVVASSLTTLSGDAFAYRGQDVAGLCASHTFEQVAEILWSAPAPAAANAPEPGSWIAPAASSALARAVLATLPAGTRPFDRLRVVVAAVGASDELRSETSPAAVTAVGRSLIATLVDALAAPGGPAAGPGSIAGSIAGRSWTALSGRRATGEQAELVDMALVLGADQGLVPSTVAARVAASVQADPYSVVVAGLGAIAGRLHGAACLGAEELLDEVARSGGAAAVIGARLRRGERIPGFGEARYPDGDPRAVLLLDRLAGTGAGTASAVARAQEVVEVMGSRGLPRPNIDFALAALTHATALQPGSSEALIAIARCAGWLAHALEEYAHPSRFELEPTAVPGRSPAP